MSATIESAYQAKRMEVATLVGKLAKLLTDSEIANQPTRNWGDVGDMERVLGAVQIAVDVLEVV